MDKHSVKIRSALWQFIFIVLLVLVPEALMLSSLLGASTHDFEKIIVFACSMLLFLTLCWAVLRYSIRADANGISQTNGFFRQSVRWDDVAAYYVEPNRRYERKLRHFFVEPVMLDANGEVIFHGFVHCIDGMLPMRKRVKQRRQFWQYVEGKLQGRPLQEPPPDLKELALERIKIESKKVDKVKWKKQQAILVISPLACMAIGATGILYVDTHHIKIFALKVFFQALILLSMCLVYAPIIGWVYKMEKEKEKIAEEIKKDKQ